MMILEGEGVGLHEDVGDEGGNGYFTATVVMSERYWKRCSGSNLY